MSNVTWKTIFHKNRCCVLDVGVKASPSDESHSYISGQGLENQQYRYLERLSHQHPTINTFPFKKLFPCNIIQRVVIQYLYKVHNTSVDACSSTFLIFSSSRDIKLSLLVVSSL